MCQPLRCEKASLVAEPRVDSSSCRSSAAFARRRRDSVTSARNPRRHCPNGSFVADIDPRGNRTGSATVRLTVAQVDEIRRKLAAQPPAPTVRGDSVSKLAAVTAAAPELLGLRRAGWGVAALAAFLTEAGLPISAGTLKNYLQRAGATPTKRRWRQRTSAPGATSPAASVSAQAAEHRSSPGPVSAAITTRQSAPVRAIPPGTFIVREDSEL